MGSSTVATANDLHHWWLDKCCAELGLAEQAKNDVGSRITTHKGWVAEQQVEVHKLIDQLKQLVDADGQELQLEQLRPEQVIANETALLRTIKLIQQLCQKVNREQQRVIQTVDKDLGEPGEHSCFRMLCAGLLSTENVDEDSSEKQAVVDKLADHLGLSGPQKKDIGSLLREVDTVQQSQLSQLQQVVAEESLDVCQQGLVLAWTECQQAAHESTK